MLVLGGARSGKSRYAERLAADGGGQVLYVAAATASDDEMRARIARHRADRPAAWLTLEAQTDLAPAIARALPRLSGATPGHPSGQDRLAVIIEDLTFLLTNLMAQDEAASERSAIAEVDALLRLEADVVLVSNEVGMGVVPAYASGRQFRDALGRLNQHAAACCTAVFLLVAGLPLRLK